MAYQPDSRSYLFDQIQLTVQSLPVSPDWTYECVFAGHGVTRITAAAKLMTSDRGNSTMRCNSPAFNLLPPFPTGKGEFFFLYALSYTVYDRYYADGR